ncbi:P60-like protein [Pisolithus orientalis]|uniref:P60-like protein n=1 Tax=Pisolithus orientalis TaxID=936130 RepID=UPI002225712F|nr:P60-like protein [Pisolithus orientalis]KAI5993086.1 P60-like protein [Pisolithus orientalis]
MAGKAQKPKPTQSALGAPSQLAQASRKGKRAWRKNIDMQGVEDTMESLRAEERVIGSTLQKQPDDQLFVVDTRGDEQLRKSLPRYSKSQLTSTKIISARSAVSAITSRTRTTTKPKLTPAEKSRLLRLAHRPRKGPFNAVMDPTELGAGSAPINVSHAVRESGTRDLWASTVKEGVPDGLESVKPAAVKKPDTDHLRNIIDALAVSLPLEGASYNPPVKAHHDLVLQAYAVEKRKQDKLDNLASYREKIEQAKENAGDVEGVPIGMILDDGVADSEDETEDRRRRRKQQRARMMKLKAEKQALAEKALRKRLLHGINSVKSLRSQIGKTAKAQNEARLARQLAARLRLRKGLAGRKFGKHVVPESRVDLSENLRSLKPEGNLFRDRFVSLQQRALVEPRVPVFPSKRRAKPILYEKHAYKRFQ